MKNCTILVNSCDTYEEIWKPFFLVLREKWKECPYPVILNTESKVFKLDGLDIRTINCKNTAPKHETWGRRLKRTLQSIDTEYVLNLFDDFLLEEPIETSSIEKCIEWMDSNKKAAVFYLYRFPGDSQPDNQYEGFDLVPQGRNYRLNSSPAIWRKEKLLEFTGNRDNPWAWEFWGSARTYKTDDLFYIPKSKAYNIYVYQQKLGGAIHRGKWVESVINPVIERYQLPLNVQVRGVEDEGLKIYRHSLAWKIKFIITGYRMIGFDASLLIWKSLKKRLLKQENKNEQ